MSATKNYFGTSDLSFRKDIEGLRALAVLSVMSFHHEWNLVPGGFIWVDMFFVISGYLITRNVFSQSVIGTLSVCAAQLGLATDATGVFHFMPSQSKVNVIHLSQQTATFLFNIFHCLDAPLAFGSINCELLSALKCYKLSMVVATLLPRQLTLPSKSVIFSNWVKYKMH